MKTSQTETRAVANSSFPKDASPPAARSKRATPNPKSQKRGNIFSKSRDTREDRGTREMKTSHNSPDLSTRAIILTMKTNPLKEGALTENSAGIGTVTRKMVHARAAELAVINGRSPASATKSDWEQAKRELTGEPDIDPKEAVLESAPESERWDPVPGSTGHKVPVAPSEDEDEEGRSDNERLVDEGIAGAELDQIASSQP